MSVIRSRLSVFAFFAFALIAGGSARADLLYASTYDNLYGTIDTSTGAFTQIGATPDRYTTLAFAPGGQLYALADPGPMGFYRVDAATGASTFIGFIGGSSFSSYGLAITPDDTFYGYESSGNSSASDFFTINPSNATTTGIGNTGFRSNGGMAADGLGHIYLTQGLGQGDGIYQIDPSTGQSTLLGNSDGGTAYAIAFVGETMYAFTPGGAIDRVDLTNGQSTQIATYDVGAIGVIGGAAAMTSAVPEPSSLTLCATAAVLLGIARARFRRRP